MAMAEMSSGDGDHHPGSEKPLLSGPLQTPPTPELGMFSGCARRFLSGLLLGLVEEEGICVLSKGQSVGVRSLPSCQAGLL